MAPQAAVPNRLSAYRAARLPHGWTQERLVLELELAGKALGIPVASRASLKVQISRWENGHHPVSENYRALFRHIFNATDEQLGFTTFCRDESIEDDLEPVSFKGTWVVAFHQAASDWEVDMERRDFLRTAAFAAGASTSPALQWLVSDPEVIVRAEGAAVGAPHVESIREMTSTFRRLDNRFGGGHARESVVRFLAREVAPLVKSGRFEARTGSSLLSASAEMLQLAGWMTYDDGNNRLGQHYMTQALRLARAAGDEPLGGEILAGLSHQASYLGDSATAVDLARAARKTALAHGLDALLAEAWVMEAHGHACAGDEAACTAALSEAETALDRADRAADPHWIGYFDDAYLAAKFGHCFKELCRPAAAQTFATQSLDMDVSYVRGRAFNLALLATAQAQGGDVEAACTTGYEVLELIHQGNSARLRRYAQQLVGELEPAASSAIVTTFRSDATSRLSA